MDFEIGKVYTFNTRSAVFLGAVIQNAKFKAKLDYSTAVKFSPIDQTYAQVYPTLPEGSVRSPKDVVYFLFELQNGSSFVYAENWIDEASIDLIEHVEITVKISRASLSDIEKIRIALSAAGIRDFVINTH